MKKRLALVTSAVLAAGSVFGTASAFADENLDAMNAMVAEINELENYRMTETITTEVEGVAVEVNVGITKVGEGFNDASLAVSVNVPGQDAPTELALEDMLRVLPDAAYVNVGAVMNLITEVSGDESLAQMASMFGITEDWVKFPAVSCDLNNADLIKLGEDAAAVIAACENGIEVEAIADGFHINVGPDTLVSMIESAMPVIEENLPTLIDDVLAIAKNADINEIVNSVIANDYVQAVLEGIKQADPNMDIAAMVPVLLESYNVSQYQEMLAGFTGEMLVEQIKAQGIELSSVPAMLREMIESEAGVEMNSTVSLDITKAADGTYVISEKETVEAEGQVIDVNVCGVVTPLDTADAVEAPAAYCEGLDVITTVSNFAYSMYKSQTESGNGYIDEPGSYEYTEPSLEVDGNRFKMTSWYDDNAWITYNDEVFNLDLESSSPNYVFLDFADGSYRYISISLENGTVQDAYDFEVSSGDYYAAFDISDLVAVEGTNVSYYVTQYSYEASTEEAAEPSYDYQTLVYTVSGDNCYAVIHYSMYDANETVEDAVATLANAIISLDAE